MKYLIILLLSLCGLEISDGLITHGAVKNGLVQEANPFMEHIVRDGNFLLFKVIGALLCVIILWGIYKRFPNMALLATSSMVVFYGGVVSWNLYVLSGI